MNVCQTYSDTIFFCMCVFTNTCTHAHVHTNGHAHECVCVCFGRHDIHIYGSVHMYFQLTRRSGSSERCIKKRMSSSVASNTPVPGSLISCSGGAELRSGGAALAACASAIAADAVSATDAYWSVCLLFACIFFSQIHSNLHSKVGGWATNVLWTRLWSAMRIRSMHPAVCMVVCAYMERMRIGVPLCT